MRRRGGLAGALVCAAAAAGVVLYGSGSVAGGQLHPTTTSSSSASSAPRSSSTSPTGVVADQLEELPVKGRAPMTGYDRSEFGQPWSDDVSTNGGKNSCDTRNDVLRRDLDPVTIKPGTNGCVALSGTLLDPFSDTSLSFVRGQDTSAEAPVDHVVALGNAYATGAQALSGQQRQELANDPMNLQSTTRALNSQKGDGDAATWLPPAKGYRCTYVTRQIEVKARYDLWVTKPEKAAMTRVLSTCPAERHSSTSRWDVPELAP